MKNRIISNKKKNGGLIPSPMESAPTSGIQITTHVIIRGISIIWRRSIMRKYRITYAIGVCWNDHICSIGIAPPLQRKSTTEGIQLEAS
jgi:hypothetical protein